MTLLKSIVVCLVLANVGYFLWARGIARTPGAPPAQTVARGDPEARVRVRGRARTRLGQRTRRALAASAGVRGGGRCARRSAAPGLLTNVKRCISVGPFRDVSEAAHAATTLRSGGYDPRQRVAEGEVWAGVWVYLPLPAARAAARTDAGQAQGRRYR